MVMMQFQRATKKKSKLRLGLAGPSNAGKTLGALMIARGLGGRIALIDTERGSASLYSSSFEFDVLELDPPYAPERFIEAIHAAEKAGYSTIIIDSMTHEWSGAGGCLEINEVVAQSKFRGNTWSAWSDTTPRHQAFIDALLQSPCHTIGTMRSKTETVQTDDKKVKKIGMKVEQRNDSEYEFGLMLEIDHATHFAVLTKGRLFDAPSEVRAYFEHPHIIGDADGAMLQSWLDSGAEVEAPPSAEDRAKSYAESIRKVMFEDTEEDVKAVKLFELTKDTPNEDKLAASVHFDPKHLGALRKYVEQGRKILNEAPPSPTGRAA